MPDDSQLIVSRLTAWLQQRWPEKRQIELKNIHPPIQGFSNETWMLDLEWEDSQGSEQLPIVVRLPPKDSMLFPSYDLSSQYRCMEQLIGSDVPVPRMLGHDWNESDGGNPFGRPFYLMQRLDGRVPGEYPQYHVGGWMHDLPSARRRTIWMNGVEMLARVNRLDWAAMGLGFLDTPVAGEPPLVRHLRSLRSFLDWAESLAEPYPLLRAALDWLETHQPQDEPIGLCWGDAKLGNCVFDPDSDRCTGVLDWESAYLGNPASDLAWWIMLDRSLCDGYGLPRLEGLPSREETIAYWEQHSGHKALNLPYYEVFCAFKFALIMARIGCMFMDRGLMPRDQRMDLHNGGSTILRIMAAEQGLPFATQEKTC